MPLKKANNNNKNFLPFMIAEIVRFLFFYMISLQKKNTFDAIQFSCTLCTISRSRNDNKWKWNELCVKKGKLVSSPMVLNIILNRKKKKEQLTFCVSDGTHQYSLWFMSCFILNSQWSSWFGQKSCVFTRKAKMPSAVLVFLSVFFVFCLHSQLTFQCIFFLTY